VQQHNAFTQLDDPAQVQRLADRFAQLNWPKVLNRWARQVNPLLCELFPGYPVHWVIDQAEYATDLLFTSRAALAGLYPALLGYAAQTFTPKDILRFLGRKWDRRFDGEVHTEYEDERWFGTRIKHRMKTNWLKMYDKFGLVLRIETVINDPREFRVRWLRTREGRREMADLTADVDPDKGAAPAATAIPVPSGSTVVESARRRCLARIGRRGWPATARRPSSRTREATPLRSPRTA
jgi:hypothetical protein